MKHNRWQQRLESFEHAYVLLKEALASKPRSSFSDLDKERLIMLSKIKMDLDELPLP